MRAYIGDGVEGSVRAETEVGSRDVIADRGRNDDHRNAELWVVLPGVAHLGHALIRLWELGIQGQFISLKGILQYLQSNDWQKLL